tara:strand:+ start:114 stop:713 length:600 start_codon:yes stop_codon:yes gene_type:complete
MKRNLILLAIILVGSLILTFLSAQKNVGRLSTVGKLFEEYGGKEFGANEKFPYVNKLRKLNLEDSQECSDYREETICQGHDVCNWYVDADGGSCIEKDIFEAYIDPILRDLNIKYENTDNPDSEPDEIGDYKYLEYHLTFNCTFEDFTQFIIELEKSDKFFIVEHISFSNDGFSDREHSTDKKFEIKIRAVELKKKGKK